MAQGEEDQSASTKITSSDHQQPIEVSQSNILRMGSEVGKGPQGSLIQQPQPNLVILPQPNSKPPQVPQQNSPPVDRSLTPPSEIATSMAIDLGDFGHVMTKNKMGDGDSPMADAT